MTIGDCPAEFRDGFISDGKNPQLCRLVNRWLPHFILLLSLHVAASVAFAQPVGAETEARQLAIEARESIAAGEFRSAADKYARAYKLCPKNIDYQMGLAHARYFLQDYPAAMDLCRAAMAGKRAPVEAYQVYGNCQDAQGQSYEALETYRQGLAHFPKSGLLYMEMGILEFARHRDAEALQYWEQGIRVQPGFASNYYFAAQRLLELGDFAWAANYAELLINLQGKGDRVREMSSLLMVAHERARHFDFEKAFKWRFYQVIDTATGLPGNSPAYHRLLDEAFSSEFTDTTTAISIAKLAESRRFVCQWLPRQLPGHPMQGLLKWQQAIAKAGHMEAYHYWLLYDARPDEFLTWFEANEAKYAAFEGWFSDNSIQRHLKRAVVRPVNVWEDKNR